MITSNLIVNVGFLLLIAIIGAEILKRFNFPVVLFYVVLGIIISPSILHLISPQILQYDYLLTQITLSLIAFTIGDTFLLKNLKQIGTSGSILSVLQAVFTTAIVIGGLLLFSHFVKAIPLAAILLLGAIAAATDPASSFMVIRQFKAKGPFTNTLLAAVSIDDAVGIILFDLLISFSRTLTGQVGGVTLTSTILVPLMDIVLSIVFGCIFGLALAFVTQRIKGNSRDTFLITSLSLVLVASGICTYFHFSPLLCCMAMGGTFSNFSNKATEVFSSLDSFTAPILLLFFIVSGASLNIKVLSSVGLIGLATIVLRSIGKIYGTEFAGHLTKSPPKIAKYLGYAMIPQAGVAMGFALTVKSIFPEYGFIITIVLANVVFSQIIGPLLAKHALVKTGEAKAS